MGETIPSGGVPSGNFVELIRTVTCMMLKVKANDRRTSCHDEFRGPRSDYVRQVALATTTTCFFFFPSNTTDYRLSLSLLALIILIYLMLCSSIGLLPSPSTTFLLVYPSCFRLPLFLFLSGVRKSYYFLYRIFLATSKYMSQPPYLGSLD
ncbi:hypothetical protein TNCV_1758041 [Trichonephila clavipes]|nr:hypothetical protein TNCV_1758041 [Trichonephila clavipes]